MGSNKKRQTTMAKLNRERAVEEKRRLKRERKQAARAERAAGGASEETVAIDDSLPAGPGAESSPLPLQRDS